jgi:hypothetical protein
VRKHFESIPSAGAAGPTFVIKHSVKATWDVPARTVLHCAGAVRSWSA